MGLSHAAAAGVLFMAAALAGFQVSGNVFDQQDGLASAWDAFYEQEQDRSGTSFTIDQVRKQGPRTEVTATNTGSTTIDAAQLPVLFDGSPVTMDSWKVNAKTSDVWAPGSVIVLLRDPWSNPQSVVLMDENGIKAYWRA